MAYEMVMPYHLHMPSYFLETFTEYPEFAHVPIAMRDHSAARGHMGKFFISFCFPR